MRLLVDEVAAKVTLPVETVNELLASSGVSVSATPPAPSRLRLQRLRFRATKLLTGVDASGATIAASAVEHVPVEFDWQLGSGLYGVGTDKNLRGKTTLLRMAMWVLRGRCGLRDDVLSWLEHVEADIGVDNTTFHVAFDVIDGRPDGSLTRVRGEAVTHVGDFANDDEFEELMGATMLAALGLPPIASAVEGRRTQHVWPTYAGALLINGDTLDQLVGEHQWSGLPSRLLQMFVGAEWAPARAQVTTALTIAKTELAEARAATDRHLEQTEQSRREAEEAVEAAQELLDALPAATGDADALNAALDELTRLDATTPDVTERWTQARAAVAVTDSAVRLERQRVHQLLEDSHAAMFFHHMQPTACPRCASPVTAPRVDAEKRGESCSICAIDLSEIESEAFDSDDGVAGDEDDHVDALEAAEQAHSAATDRLAETDAARQRLVTRRAELTQIVASNRPDPDAAATRRATELLLARAQGALSAVERVPDVGDGIGSTEDLELRVKVLTAAQRLIARWVTDDQASDLESIAAAVTTLARSFGMANLTAVRLGGGATMKVVTGGAESNFSDCERGERLRLKLATAIAMVSHARTTGVGRHPGMLLVDAPGAEEVDDDDFDTMLLALRNAADEAGIQVIIATRHTDALADIVGEDRCRLGRGMSFAW